MPSTKNPADVVVGAGRAPVDTVPASALDFPVDTQVMGEQLALEIGALSFGRLNRGPSTLGSTTDSTIGTGSDSIFVGLTAGDDIEDLFQIVKAGTYERIINAAQTGFVKVTSIAGASIGDVWSGGPITVTADELPGQSWEVLYADRTGITSLPEDSFSQGKLRNLPSDRENVLYLQHGGLDARYRCKTTTTATALDTAGAGAVIIRDGEAPQSKSVDLDYNPANQTTASQPDPYLANWMVELPSYGDTDYATDRSGEMGYVFKTGHQQRPGVAGEYNSKHHPLSNFTTLLPRDIRTDTLDGDTVRTRIAYNAPATLNPSNLGGDLIDLTGSDYYWNGSSNSAINVGFDLLEVTFPDSTKQFFIIKDLVSATRAQVVTLGGASPDFDLDVSVTVQWYQVILCAGGTIGNSLTDDIRWSSFGVYRPTPLTEDSTDDKTALPPFFSAPSSAGETSSDGNLETALEWGGHNPSSTVATVRRKGRLYGCGGMRSYGGRITGFHTNPSYGTSGTGATITFVFDPANARGSTATLPGISLYSHECTASAATAVAINLSLAAEYTPSQGDRITVVVSNVNGANITMGWESGKFLFSGSDDSIPFGIVGVYKWEGVYSIADTGSKFLMTRTDY